MTEITLGDFQEVLSYLIDNNRRLVDSGDTPISVCLEGDAGIGKTAVVQQLAEAKGMSFVKINLAQIEEPAELVGFPFKEYRIKTDNGDCWMSADVLKEMNCDFQVTSESRMSYAVPGWVPRDFNDKGTMLVLDDFSRANSLILQAVMEILNTGSYVSWNLPKYTNIVLTSNPDDGNYSVTGLDQAQKSRFICFKGRFEIKEWARWAEMFGIDGRAINFAMMYDSELFQPKADSKGNPVHAAPANARSFTTFCRSIGGIADWEKEDSMAFILKIASGCFLDDNNIVGSLFTRFINGHLDKLITPDRMVNGPWEQVKKEMVSCVYKSNGNYRADMANILATRFLNYVDKHLGSDKAKSNDVRDRIEAIYLEKDSGKQIFSEDIVYNIVRTLGKSHPNVTNTWYVKRSFQKMAV